MAIPLTLRFWLFILLLALALWALFREPAAGGSAAAMPEQLIGEPDLYLETAHISQYGDAGKLRYELFAERIRHFETAAITRLEAPDLTLHSAGALPWQTRAGQGFIRTEVGPQGLPEEIVFLRDAVNLQQRDLEGRFVTMSTAQMTVYPDREYAQTDHSVTIDTETGHTRAAAMTADLAAGVINLSADAEQRVETFVRKDQFK